MSGHGFTIFDSAVGRCGIAWGHLGIIGVQLPEARELETRRRMYRVYPEAREQRPPLNTEIAIEGIVTLLRGGNADMGDVALDFSGMPYFNSASTSVSAAFRAARPAPMRTSRRPCACRARSIRWRRPSAATPS
jgi:hypothetical protein